MFQQKPLPELYTAVQHAKKKEIQEIISTAFENKTIVPLLSDIFATYFTQEKSAYPDIDRFRSYIIIDVLGACNRQQITEVFSQNNLLPKLFCFYSEKNNFIEAFRQIAILLKEKGLDPIPLLTEKSHDTPKNTPFIVEQIIKKFSTSTEDGVRLINNLYSLKKQIFHSNDFTQSCLKYLIELSIKKKLPNHEAILTALVTLCAQKTFSKGITLEGCKTRIKLNHYLIQYIFLLQDMHSIASNNQHTALLRTYEHLKEYFLDFMHNKNLKDFQNKSKAAITHLSSSITESKGWKDWADCALKLVACLTGIGAIVLIILEKNAQKKEKAFATQNSIPIQSYHHRFFPRVHIVKNTDHALCIKAQKAGNRFVMNYKKEYVMPEKDEPCIVSKIC